MTVLASVALVIGVCLLLVFIMPVLMALVHYPLPIPGIGSVISWYEYWIDKSIEWENRE